MILLIASGTYITPELASEFGQLPPSLMPLGNRRLLEWQLALNKGQFNRVFITLPNDFALDISDLTLLADRQVQIIKVDPTWSLGKSIQHALQIIKPESSVSLLYGDTLVEHWPAPEFSSESWIGTGQSNDNYEWHVDSASLLGDNIWIGVFHFDRPYALIDSLHEHCDFISAVNHYTLSNNTKKISITDWLDFGHVQTYYKSKTQITTQRAFNELDITDGIVYKQSHDCKKMLAESSWLEFAPPEIKKYLPAHYGKIYKNEQLQGYISEYLTYPALADLFVFGKLPSPAWRGILQSCRQFIETISTLTINDFDINSYCQQIYAEKTRARLKSFSSDTGINLDQCWHLNDAATPSMNDMAEECISHVLRSHQTKASVIHGDFCFSNILYDFRSARIKAIDPRGMNACGEPTPFGDLRYEIAKLAHSVLGLYDFIVADRFSLEQRGNHISLHIDAPHVQGVQTLFANTQFNGKRPEEWDCMPIMVLLFLSMLPLHSDSRRRQTGLMANAMRIYLNWKGATP